MFAMYPYKIIHLKKEEKIVLSLHLQRGAIYHLPYHSKMHS